jgi:hypothetical protein
VGRYTFELATRADDAQLRAMLAATPMAGRIAVSFRREPSFFDAAVVDGDFHQVVVCRDQEHGQIVGFGCRSVRNLFVNGRPTPVGYLSLLRVLPGYRNMGLVARGYAYFRRLHGDGRTALYLTTIAEGNELALSTVTTGRARLPEYAFAGRYHTVVIPIARRRREFKSRDTTLQIREATADDRDGLLAFLAMVGPARQFFPCFAPADFFEKDSTFKDLAPADLLVAVREGRVVGTLGGWNQQGFRQSVVEGYTGYLRWGRPLYNAWAVVRGLPRLPRVGEPLRYLMAAIPAVAGNERVVFEALLQGLLARASGGPCDYVLVGLHESDPLLPFARRFGAESYVTRMYVVRWQDESKDQVRLDERPAYLELGFL